MCKRKQWFSVILCVWCVVLSPYSTAQTLRVLDISTAQYPRVEAQCVMYDAQKRVIYPQRVQDIVLRENARLVENVRMILPERKIPRSISAVLALDISASMEGARLDNAKSAAYTLIEEMPFDLSECAITSFDDRTSIVRDFSQNREDLLAGVYSLKHGGGTDYNAALMGKAGAFRVLEHARFRKVVIFLTDGLSDADTSSIIRQARALGATVYCVTLNMPMPNVLRFIAEQTGGKSFENIRSREEAHAIYREILRQELDIQPFTIAWNVTPNCASEHAVDIALPKYNARESMIVEKPEAQKIALKILPRFLHFPVLQPGSTQGVAVKLQAHNASFQVLGVTSSNTAFSPLTTRFPLDIPAETTKILRLRYAPKDTNYISAEVYITTDRCGVITLRVDGGSRSTRTKENLLALSQPIGGETLWIGADTTLLWSGISTEELIDVDISANNEPFERLFTGISGLQQPWNITTGEGDSVRLRITKPWRVEAIKDPPTLSLVGHRGAVNHIKYSADGTMIVTAGDDATVRIWNAETGDIIRAFPAEQRPFISAKFVQNDKSILASNIEGKVILYDVASGAIKQTYIAFGAQGSTFMPPDNSKSDSPEPAFIWVPDIRGRLTRVPNPHYNGGSRSSVTNDPRVPIFDRFEIYDAALSPDGKSIVGVGEFPSPVQWFTRTGRMDKKLSPLKSKNYAVEFSPSGSYLVVAGEKGLALYSTSGSLIRVHDGVKGSVVAFTMMKNDVECIYGTNTGEIIHIEITTGTILHRTKPHSKMIVAIAQSPNKQYVAVASVDHTISIHRIDNLQEVGRIYGGISDYLNLAFSPDGRSIAATSADGTAHVWNFDVEYEFQSYTMHRPFTVLRPHFLTSSIVFGSVEVGQKKDSVFKARLRNPHKIPLWVGLPIVVGRDSLVFRVVSGGNRFIPPFDSTDIELRFYPRRIGLHDARIAFPAIEDTTFLSVTATGVSPIVSQSASMLEGLECGDEKIGSIKNIRFDNIFKNVTDQSLMIVDISVQSPDSVFTVGTYEPLVASGGMFSLPIVFQPHRRGFVSARMKIHIASVSSPRKYATYTLIVSGNGVTQIIRGALIAKNSSGAIVDTVRIRRIPVQSAQPLLPYIFFEHNSSSIPDRYHRQKQITTATLISLSALDAHFYLLDIIGKRLQSHSTAAIELVGCNAHVGEEKGNIELSKRRAETIKQYWVATYSIAPQRIVVSARNLPVQFSQGKEVESIAENRRVEISSNSPVIMAPIEIIDTINTFQPDDVFLKVQQREQAEIAKNDTVWASCRTLPLEITLRSGLDLLNIEGKHSLESSVWHIQRSSANFGWRSGAAILTATSHKEIAIGQCGVEIEPCRFVVAIDTHQARNEELSAIPKRWNLILFSYNSSALSQQNKSIVKSIGQYLTTQAQQQEILVEGYTDIIGEEGYNRELSMKRAKSVAQLLNIPNTSLAGIGEEVSLFPNNLPEGRFLNRTVRITVR